MNLKSSRELSGKVFEPLKLKKYWHNFILIPVIDTSTLKSLGAYLEFFICFCIVPSYISISYQILIILSLLQSPLYGWLLSVLSLVGVMSLLNPVSSEYFFLFPESSAFLLEILIFYFNWKKDQHWLAEPTSYHIHL